MNKNKENMEWEMEAPTLASLPRITPYQVPENYFDELQNNMMAQVKLREYDQSGELGFKVPENYFEESKSQLIARIQLESYTADKENSGFTHPDGYFEQLQASILAKTTAEKKSKGVFKLWQNDIAKYAVAACFVILSAVGLYFNNQTPLKPAAPNVLSANTNSVDIQEDAMLYNIDERLIIEHLVENESANNVQVAAMASSNELEEYLLENYSAKDLSINY